MLTGKHVLVVEDEPLIADGFRAELEERGARVSCAADCAAALKLIAEMPIDFAVLDIKLTNDETCYPVAEELRRRGTPFVFATGYSVSRCDFANIPLFTKPTDMRELFALLKGLAASAPEEIRRA
jgi:DNA-binding response OmpR family regulator